MRFWLQVVFGPCMMLTDIAGRDIHAGCGLRTQLTHAPDSLVAALACEVGWAAAAEVIPCDGALAAIEAWPRLKDKKGAWSEEEEEQGPLFLLLWRDMHCWGSEGQGEG